MSKRDVIAQPGTWPTEPRTAGPMFAALYGQFSPYDWRDPESDRDPYALFYQRSLAMGWHDDRSAGGGSEEAMVRAPGLWAMNDAGWDHPLADPDAALVSWFQVEASAVPDDRPLPVRPFLRCAEDATARVGTLTLTAVHLVIPVQGLDASSRPAYAPSPSMLTVHWFAERDPRASTSVEISLNSGEGPSVAAVARELVDIVGELDQDVFVVRSFDVSGQTDASAVPVADGFWNGPPMQGVVLRGELAEWSCDAIGWTIEVIADSLAQLKLASPLLATVVRA